MKRSKSPKSLIPWLKALSGLSVNLSAAWFGLAVVTPNFANILKIETVVTLTRDVLFGIIFLLLTVFFEKHIS